MLCVTREKINFVVLKTDVSFRFASGCPGVIQSIGEQSLITQITISLYNYVS